MNFDLQNANAGVSSLVCGPTMRKGPQSGFAHLAQKPISSATAKSIIPIRSPRNGTALNAAPGWLMWELDSLYTKMAKCAGSTLANDAQDVVSWGAPPNGRLRTNLQSNSLTRPERNRVRHA